RVAVPRWAPLVPELRGDSLVVRFRMPDARSVAIAGEWNSWQPVRLRPVGDDVWEGALRLRRGLYHFNLQVDGSEWVVPNGVATDFVSGIGWRWVYAAIRPRFGAGVQTALIAGLAVWFFVGLLHAIGESPMGFMPQQLMVIGTCVALISLPVATVAGAYVYKEL